jgi:dihydrofolate reductase
MTGDDVGAERMHVALIWAQSRNRVIGSDGGIPWHLPEDLARFRELTTGAPVIMGRRTWDSLPQRFRPLPGRRNIVVTRQRGWDARGTSVAHTLDEALEVAAAARPADAIRAGDPAPAGPGRTTTTTTTAWVIGGGELYREALPRADRLEVTEVDVEVEGDTRAPEVETAAGWEREPAGASADWETSRTGVRYRFVTWRRRAVPRPGPSARPAP